MQTKTITKEEKNLSFSLPSHIQQEVKEKWFYIYEWISPKDVKMSIERDFLKTLSFLWIPLAIISVILWVIFYWNILIMFSVFFWFILIISILIIIYLLYFAITRSLLLSKNSFVIITDSSLSVNWKIEKHENIKNLWDDINMISNTFEENIFKDSNLEKTNSTLFRNIIEKLWNWYKWIFNTLWKSNWKNSWQLILLVLFLYTLYAIIMWFIFFVWVLIIWLFWLFLMWINKLILIKSWHEVLTINDLFWKIDESSKIIHLEKDKLLENLENAKNNDWKDWLLTNLNNWIQNISEKTNNAIEKSIELKKKLENSKYSEMFNFSIFNSWVKKQIYDPLSEIYNLLEININLLIENKTTIEKQVLETKDIPFQWILTAQKKRIEMRIEEIEKYIGMIKIYMDKLG